MNESSCSDGRVVHGLVLTDINGQNMVHFFADDFTCKEIHGNVLKQLFKNDILNMACIES